MRRLNLFVYAFFLLPLSNDSIADLTLAWKEVETSYSGPSMQWVADNGNVYWVKAHVATSPGPNQQSYLALENFFDRTPVGRIEVSYSPVFFPIGQPHRLVLSSNARAEWRLLMPDSRISKPERQGELKSVLGVTASTKVDDGYIIAGFVKDEGALKALGQDKRPILVKVDRKLKTERELRMPDKGQVNSLFTQAGTTYAVIDYEQKPSEILTLTTNLSILKRHRIPTGAVTGIALQDGGFAITYTALPSMDVMLEKIDNQFRAVWQKKLFARKGISSNLYVMRELPDGLAVVGKRDDRLHIVRVSEDGRRMRITEDTFTGFRTAATDPYFVGVRGNEIHIRGVSQGLDNGNHIAFHFIETP
jgi:hypothetical protein